MQANGQYLNYTVAIDQTMSPSDVFSNASMDTSWSTGTAYAKTTIFEPNPDVILISTNGNPSATVTLPGGLTFLTVSNAYWGGGYLTQETDAFLEVTIPEPSPFVLLLTGLASIAMFTRGRNEK